jgi:putative phosphoesterase
MKIAVISDIHGNLDALDAVVEDIKSQECDKIFALGDYAMAGAEPSRTVDFFISQQNEFTLIQGNTDLMIANYTDELYNELKSKAPIMAEALKNDYEILNPIQKAFLKKLPIQLEVEEDGLKILLVHGSPRKNNEDILPDVDLDELEKMLEHVDANIVLCGHTHIPCGFQTASKKTVVNVGSVGRPFTLEPKSCYLKMTIENGQALFEHRFVDYDKQKASEKLAKRNFKGADKLASMLLDPKVRHF